MDDIGVWYEPELGDIIIYSPKQGANVSISANEGNAICIYRDLISSGKSLPDSFLITNGKQIISVKEGAFQIEDPIGNMIESSELSAEAVDRYNSELNQCIMDADGTGSFPERGQATVMVAHSADSSISGHNGRKTVIWTRLPTGITIEPYINY